MTAPTPAPEYLVPAARSSAQPAPLRVFVRQPLTRTVLGEQRLVDDVLRLVPDQMAGSGRRVQVLTGRRAERADTFRESFERATGLPFTPAAFRRWRLAMLRRADAMVVVRTNLSESGAYKISYNVHAGARAPMLVALWRPVPLTTTLLRDLHEHVAVTYVEFDTAAELAGPLHAFLTGVDAGLDETVVRPGSRRAPHDAADPVSAAAEATQVADLLAAHEPG